MINTQPMLDVQANQKTWPEAAQVNEGSSLFIDSVTN